MTARSAEIWGTWEDLLLASAVARHGPLWDAVASEVRSRSAAPDISPDSCLLRFRLLRRRFSPDDDTDVSSGSVPWVDDLRKLRVAELRREVERSDLSIASMQLKVKRLKEEREQSSGAKSDLKDDADESPSPPLGQTPPDQKLEVVTGEEKAASCNGSTDTIAAAPKGEAETEAVEEGGGGKSGESAAESKEGSDVQSSASLSRRRRRGRRSKAAAAGVHGGSQPLMAILEMIQGKEYGAVFEHRLESQETTRYNSIIKRHMDLQMVRAKISQGAYETLEFFRDLLLLCTNAIVFFPRHSPESMAAVRLRNLVMSEIPRGELKRPVKEPTPPLLLKDLALPLMAKETTPMLSQKLKLDLDLDMKRPAPLIMCKKRSSISTKPATSLPVVTTPAEEMDEKLKMDVERKEPDPDDEILAKKMSGTRRVRTTKNRPRSTAATLKAPIIVHEPAPVPAPVKVSALPVDSPPAKPHKKSGGGGISSKKRGAAATFLNRINGKSPSSNTLLESLKASSSGKGSDGRKGDSRKEHGRGKSKAATEKGSQVKRSVGRPPKRVAPSLTPPPPAKRMKEDAAAGPSKAPAMPNPKKRVRK